MSRSLNPYRVKRNRSYTATELSVLLGCHKNTIRLLRREGLAPIDQSRPMLFHGGVVRKFLAKRNADRKRPCPPGTFFCFGCGQPRRPALNMVDFVELTPESGNLRGLCEECGTLMYRRSQRSAVSNVMPGIAVQFTEAPSRLVGSAGGSGSCDFEGDYDS